MDKVRKQRKIVRGSFTRLYNQILTDISSEETDILSDVQAKFETLKLKYEELQKLDRECMDLMLEADDTKDEEFENESKSSDEYNNKFFKVKNIFDKRFNETENDNLTIDRRVQNRKFKLPKIELEKYEGSLKGWLSFWSMFKKIDEDTGMDPEDKFQYLIQCTVPNSRARELVQSYPATAENYPKVIDSFKARFGKDDVLVELYIRELLSLVIQNTKSQASCSLSSLHDQLESQLRALDSLGVHTKMYDAILFPLVESCIPEDLLRVWQRQPKIGETPKDRLDGLMIFIRNEVESEQRISMAIGGFELKKAKMTKERRPFHKTEEGGIPTANDLFSGDKRKEKVSSCIFCNKPHESKDCFQAQKMSLAEKQDKIKGNRACFACLKLGHRVQACKTNVKCIVCGRKHWAVLCPEILANQKKNEVLDTEERKEQQNSSLSNLSCSEEVLLQTLQVRLVSNKGTRTVRALIDSGSQRSYILKKTAKEMGYKSTGFEELIHTLFGGTTLQKRPHQCYTISVSSSNRNYNCDIKVLDQAVICGKLPRLKRGPWEKELKENNIWIADYGEGTPDIELLIGADYCGQLFTGKMHKLKSGLIAVETKLGWLVMGKVPGEKCNGLSAFTITSLFSQTSTIANLWELDILGIRDPVETKSREEMEKAAIDHFRETISVNADERYEVHLPWLEASEALKDNMNVAERRCISTSLKLKREGRFDDYDAVFKDWEKSGIIEIVPEEELRNPSHYLPHRGVFKENSTTQVRPVFDASCHEKGFPSLNDCLEKGPNLLEEIPPLLMRFRKDKIGVVADIRKAFLQIAITRKDCDFLRFLWWEDYERRKLKIFRHRRVVFGLTCSPFLLAAVLNHHIQESPSKIQETADRLTRSFYVDNCVTSVPNEKKLQEFIQESRHLMEKGGFDLRGWEHTILQENGKSEKPIPVLGLLWDKGKDNLFCDLTTVNEINSIVTRRSVLSTVHKIFDPLGFLCPVTLPPKIIVQQTWNLKIGWDTELPKEIQKEFEDWSRDLPLLSNITIPRNLDVCEANTELSLHTFSDASKSAYSAAVFLRRIHETAITVRLIQAKSRVAPLRKMTIPRLELLACCIGARLASTVRKAMDLQDIPITFWTDSSTALGWIQRDEHWGVFVNNRVNEIRALSTKETWRHVPGEHNPADLPSRGCSVKALLKSKWWEGPLWLKQNEKDWPITEVQTDEREVSKEKRKGIVSSSSFICTETEGNWYSKRFSKYSQILRMIAWIFRFVNNSLKPNNKLRGELSVKELEFAEKKLVKIVQREAFKDEEFQMQLKTLCTFPDNEGLIRLKTKITRRNDDEYFLCPIVLPSKHEIVDKLIHERHLQSLHAGVQAVLTGIRQRFWILRGRKTVQRVITKCVRCRRHAAKGIESIPTPLPEDRIRDSLVFEVTGVDLAGPLYLKNGEKSWILLFTCAVYRAVHLELIQSLSSNCFILGLRRFIARRGRPKIMYSDNGSNFVGTENLMKSINWERIVRDTSIFRIQWKFNPPTAAWWGGWWERVVQMVKKLLRRVLGKASLMYEEMMTILCDAEAVINARPLTYVSEDPQDLVPLSPSMFIQDIRTVGVPDLDNLDQVNISKRWRYHQRLREEFRRRFRDEYLSLLVQSPLKNKHLVREIKVGDIVLVKCDNKKRIDWPLGRIVATFPGRDNCTRVVKVKTAVGESTRPVQNVYPLEISHTDPLCQNGKSAKDELETAVPNRTVTDDTRTADKIVPDNKTKVPDIKTNVPDKDISVNIKTRCGRNIVKPKIFDI